MPTVHSQPGGRRRVALHGVSALQSAHGLCRVRIRAEGHIPTTPPSVRSEDSAPTEDRRNAAEARPAQHLTSWGETYGRGASYANCPSFRPQTFVEQARRICFTDSHLGRHVRVMKTGQPAADRPASKALREKSA